MLTAIPLEDRQIWSPIPPIFQDIATDEGRHATAKPWLAGSFVYATDGAILCRMHCTVSLADLGLFRTAAPFKRASILPSFFAHEWVETSVPLPDGSPAIRDCPECQGRGCDFCDHVGNFFACERVEVEPGLILNSRYIAILRSHGVTSVRRAVEPLVEYVHWRAGDVEGVLMPMNPETPTCP